MYCPGESEYLIKQQSVPIERRTELIMDTGIGVDGYSIIGQGKISEIVSSKPGEQKRDL